MKEYYSSLWPTNTLNLVGGCMIHIRAYKFTNLPGACSNEFLDEYPCIDN